jgi:hypothetical protein
LDAQQPEQFDALQLPPPPSGTPAEQLPSVPQVAPKSQAAQAAPRTPHAVAAFPGWQSPLESQQPAQVDDEHDGVLLHEGLGTTNSVTAKTAIQRIMISAPSGRIAV